MAARNLEHNLSAANLASADVPLVGDEDVPMLNSAAIDQHLSLQRQSAANFKRLSDPEPTYRRVVISEEESTLEERANCAKIRDAIALRDKWLYKRETPEWLNCPEPRHSDYTVFVPPPYHPFDQALPPSSEHVCQWRAGIVNVFSDRKSVMRRRPQFQAPPLSEYATDLTSLMNIINDPECRSLCYQRLVLLQRRFDMYIVLNEKNERLSQIRVPHRDFYNVRKVDVHGKSFPFSSFFLAFFLVLVVHLSI